MAATLPAQRGETASAPRLSLSGVRKALGGQRVVDGIDLSVQAGETLVLLGPSGCGKTTTLGMVAGFLEPDEGEIRLSGTPVAGLRGSVPTERRGLGMVFQSYAVWPHKTVADNVAFGLRGAGLDRAALRRRVGAVLDLVQLGAMGERYPGELSGGQQQRVALARAVVVEPSLLLLDEPLSNLDARLRRTMRVELKRLNRQTGMTSLYVTHDQEEALILADRLAVMNAGRIEQADTPEAVYRRPRTPFVATFVGAGTLIDGEVAGHEGGGVLVRTALGAPLRAGAGSELAGAAPGTRVLVVLRPEDVLLGAPDDGVPAARLIEATFLGGRYDVEVEVGGQRIVGHAASLDAARDGRLGLRLVPGRAWAMPWAPVPAGGAPA